MHDTHGFFEILQAWHVTSKASYMPLTVAPRPATARLRR